MLASLAVSLGLLMSTKLLRRRGPDLLAAHEVLSLATIAAIVIHGVALLGYGLALLGLTYYLRRYIGAARWRSVHRLTAVVWLAGLGHALGEGTDAGQPWFLVMLATVVIPALMLLATRLIYRGRPPAPSNPQNRGDIRTVPAGAVATAGVAVRG